LPERGVFWLNATDPASLCGVQIDALKKKLPSRVPGTHVVYHGERLVVASRRNGQELAINVAPNDPNLQQYFGFLHHLLNRSFQPLRRVTINTINGEGAADSPYLDSLKTGFHVISDYRSVILYKS
jgi:ATP-dependent Lhr-like helicase